MSLHLKIGLLETFHKFNGNIRRWWCFEVFCNKVVLKILGLRHLQVTYKTHLVAASDICDLFNGMRKYLMASPEPPQTFKMKSFRAIVNAWKSLTIVAKLSIINVCRGPGYASKTGSILEEKRRIHLKPTHCKLVGFRNSHRRCSVKKAVLKNFTKVVGIHLCWSLAFKKDLF